MSMANAVLGPNPIQAPDHFAGKIITIERFILEKQKGYPGATGTLTNILYDIALSAKIIASRTTKAGLVEILGSTGRENVQGETVQKLDEYADRILFKLNDHTGRLAVMASEEHPDILPIPDHYPTGPYVLLFDPLDGSSNIDVNVSIGTIFAIYRRKSLEGRGTLDDCLQQGRDLVAAGYVIYGASTMLVYSTGQGVHGFTLDPSVGEFLLSHPNIQFPNKPKYYSTNQGYELYWSEGVRRYTAWLQGKDGSNKKPLSMRYIGSMVADFHRNLLSGGIFYYPADTKDGALSHGKLRLVYECAPMAFLAEQAGGAASDGHQRILDIQPSSLHDRIPFFVGNQELVAKAEEFLAEYDG
jgi:fructose-1,6-bisphosphatase I